MFLGKLGLLALAMWHLAAPVNCCGSSKTPLKREQESTSSKSSSNTSFTDGQIKKCCPRVARVMYNNCTYTQPFPGQAFNGFNLKCTDLGDNIPWSLGNHSKESFQVPTSPWCEGNLALVPQDSSKRQFPTDDNELATNKSICVEIMYLEPDKIEYEIENDTDDPYTYYDNEHDEDSPSWKIAKCTHQLLHLVPKCCKSSEAIDTRLGSCTETNMTTNLKNFRMLLQKKLPTFEGALTDQFHWTINDHQLNNFPIESKKYMIVDDNSFQLTKNGSLKVTLPDGNSNIYQQQKNGPAQYCLDYVIEKCNYKTLTWGPSLTAILVNPYNASINFDLSSQPIFGTRPETSSAFNSIKLTGYSVSLCFFIITLYVQLKEYKQISDEIKKKGTLTRKNKFSKRLDMLIGAAIVVGLMVLYSALLMGQIIELVGCNGCRGCKAVAAFFYFMVIFVFCGMYLKMYHVIAVMKKFKRGEKQSLLAYTTSGIGVPLVLTIFALGFDESVKELKGSQLFMYRPGFAEENFTFTKCSMGIYVFLYAPICLMVLINFILYIVAANFMRKQFTRIERGRSTLHQEEKNPKPDSKISSLKWNENMMVELTVVKKIMFRSLKLLIAMGLTWGVEICKGIHSHFDDSNDNSTPGKVLNFLNLLNVFLGPLVFLALIDRKARKQFFERFKKKFRMCPAKAEEEGSKAELKDEDSLIATGSAQLTDEPIEMTPRPEIHATTKVPESTVVEQSGNKKE